MRLMHCNRGNFPHYLFVLSKLGNPCKMLRSLYPASFPRPPARRVRLYGSLLLMLPFGVVAHLYYKMIQASVDKFLCFFAFHGYSSIINQPSCRSCARLIRDLRIVRCTRRHREQTISCTTSYRLGLFWRQNQFRGDLTQYTSSKSLCPNQRQIRGKSHCFIVLFIARLLSEIRDCRGCC